MEPVIPLVMFTAGFVLLLVGADYLVRGAGSFAKNLSISTKAIGLTVFAFGTSAPEFVTNVFASVGRHEEIVFGNIIGTNIFNLLCILGIVGLVHPLRMRSSLVRRQLPFSLVVTVLLAILCNDVVMFGLPQSWLSHLDGGILLFGGFQAFIVFLLFVLNKAQAVEAHGYQARIPDAFGETDQPTPDDLPLDASEVTVYSPGRTALMIAIAGVATVLGGYLVVEHCARLAALLGVRQRLLALTIIAAGTSIPELLVSLLAARRGHTDIAIANIVGSNVFNIVFILGAGAVIYAAPFDTALNVDLMVLCAATLAFGFLTRRQRAVRRWEAAAMVAAYLAYLGYVLWRG